MANIVMLVTLQKPGHDFIATQNATARIRKQSTGLRREIAGDIQDQLGEAVGVGVDLAVNVGYDGHVRGDPSIGGV